MSIGLWGRTRTSRQPAALPPLETPIQQQIPGQQLTGSLPLGVVDVATEARLALTVLEDTARRRFVDLQMAVEPFLVAKADINDCQNCLRTLLAAAIDRADSGVLITAVRRGDSVDIDILDDCGTEPASMHLLNPDSVPQGVTVTAEYLRDHGTKISLRLPYPQIGTEGEAETWTLAET
jgi:hypothetical protein